MQIGSRMPWRNHNRRSWYRKLKKKRKKWDVQLALASPWPPNTVNYEYAIYFAHPNARSHLHFATVFFARQPLGKIPPVEKEMRSWFRWIIVRDNYCYWHKKPLTDPYRSATDGKKSKSSRLSRGGMYELFGYEGIMPHAVPQKKMEEI